MSTYSEIISKWPSIADFAQDVKVSVGLVSVWKHRNSIPPEYWAAINASAASRGIDGVTLDALAGIAAAKREAA